MSVCSAGMARLGSILLKLQQQWALGFTVSLALVLSVAAYAFLTALVLVPLGFVFQLLFGVAVSEAELTSAWLLVLGVVWLPLAVGWAYPSIREEIGRSAREEAERRR